MCCVCCTPPRPLPHTPLALRISRCTLPCVTARCPHVFSASSTRCVSHHAVLCYAMQEERETLREQLCAVPAEADPTDIAINAAKVRA